MRKPKVVTLLTRGMTSAALVAALSYPADIFAEASTDHLVSSQALQQQVENVSAVRQKNIATVTDFLSGDVANRAMRDAHIDPVQVRTAIPTLSDQELANLASRSADAQQRFSAGFLGLGTLVLIIVLVAVIIIVAAVH